MVADSLRGGIFGLHQLLQGRVVLPVQLFEHRESGLPGAFSRALNLVGAAAQPGGEALVEVGLENLAENLLLFPAGSVQEFAEFPLRQHDNLAELLAVEPQQLLDAGVCLLAGENFPVRHRQLHRAARLDHLLFALGVDHLLGGAADVVLLVLQRKGKLDIAHLLLGGVLAFKGIGGAGVAAGVGVQRVADGVEDGGFTGAGRPADEEDAAFKAGKVNLLGA